MTALCCAYAVAAVLHRWLSVAILSFGSADVRTNYRTTDCVMTLAGSLNTTCERDGRTDGGL